MSTPGGADPSTVKDVDRRRSLGKYVKRMSSVFKRDRPTRSGTSSAAASAPSTPAPKTEKELVPEETAPAA